MKFSCAAVLFVFNRAFLALTARRSHRWLHGGTGCAGGAATPEGRAPAEPRARAGGELQGGVITSEKQMSCGNIKG